jgi:hypothetical protein
MPITEELQFPEPTKQAYPTQDPVKAGTYQVVVDDVKIIDGKNFTTKEPEKNLLFKTRIIEKKNTNHYMGVFARISWFNGVTKKGSSVSPSKLYTIVKALYNFYDEKMDVDKLTLAELNMGFFNELIGKQLMIVVDLRDDVNKVTGFSPIKEELEVPEKAKIDDESVNPDDIPF